MNNVRRALAQTSVSTANTLHPSMLAARLSFTLCSRPTPSKHITKAEITFGNMIAQPLPYNTRPHQAQYIQTHRGHHDHHPPPHHHGEILTAHQPATQHALTNSHFRPHCLKVKCHLTAFEYLLSVSLAVSHSLSLICFCCNFFFFNGSNTKGWHTHTQDKLVHYLCNLIRPLPSPSR